MLIPLEPNTISGAVNPSCDSKSDIWLASRIGPFVAVTVNAPLLHIALGVSVAMACPERRPWALEAANGLT